MRYLDITIDLNGVDVDVTVGFEPGYFKRGSRSGHPDSWTPDEGEAAEIHSVTLVLGSGRQLDLTNRLTKAAKDAIQKACDNASEPEPDYDYEPDDIGDDDWQDAQDRYERSL